MNNRARLLGGVMLLVVGVAFGCGLAEIGLRVYAAANPGFASRLRQHDLLEVKVEPMGPYGYRQRPNVAFHYDNGTVATSNALGYRGPVVSVAKPPRTIRIELVGGSTTHGWGVNDDQTIDAYMRRDLATRYPGRHFQVINFGFDGYDSYQDCERIRTQGLRFDPDVIIVNAGINDVRDARFSDLKNPDPRTLLYRTTVAQLEEQAVRGHPSLKTWVKHFVYLARFASMVHDAWLDRNMDNRAATVRARPHYGALNYFEQNIRGIAALAAGHHAALLLSTPPSAIPANFSPKAISPRSYWIENAAVTQAVRDSLDARMRKIAASLAASGQRVAYVEHHAPPTVFLDDAHLAPAGNAEVARDFVAATARILGMAHAAHSKHGPAASGSPAHVR